ncbi:MAG: hypothetical protein KDC87_19200, partial [Planctomycetes bacterium]|nr:hypothetical protein [Planctomycetota bacterium]
VVPLGEHLYYLGRHSVGRVPLSGGKVEQLVELPDWVEPRGMASDGRYLYAAATPFSLVTIDLVDLRTLKPLASIPRGSEEIQNVAMDNEGHLLVVTANPSGNARLLRYHHTSGVLLNQLVLPLIGARAVAQDPENGLIHVVGATAPSTSGVLTIADWKVARGPVGNLPNALPALVIQRPRHAFFQRGLGCKADDGKVPSIGTVGRPGQRAPYFGVTVATTPNSPVLFCAGIEDTNVGPFDLKIIGAPGCWLAVDPFVIAFHRTDARGAAIQYLPHAATPTQYNGIRLNAQWVVGASTANLLGAALSDAVRITIRD